MSDHEPENRVSAYLAGSPVEAELLDAVRREPAVLDTLADHLDLETLLTAWGAAARGGRFTEEVRARIEAEPSGGAFASSVRHRIERSRRQHWLARVSGAAAALVLAAAGIGWWMASDSPAARLSGDVAAEWAGEIPVGLRPGDPIELKAGLAELSFADGTVMILEAPARVRLAGRDRVRVESGSLTVRVPKGAEGFRVDTPSSEVVDLGTEFAVSVGADGSSEVHVLEGRVKARRDAKEQFVHLDEGRGLRFGALARKVEAIESNPARFVRALPGRSTKRPGYLHWSFDEGDGDVAADTGTGIDSMRYPATLKAYGAGEGPRWGGGRFGGAIYFNGADAFAATDYPGIEGTDPRTIAFWARVPQDFKTSQGFGMLGWGTMQPSSAWQISPNPTTSEGPLGRLRIGTHTSFAVGSTDLRDDRWHHLAVVMYGGHGADVENHILLYIDGRLETTTVKSLRTIDTDIRNPRARTLFFGRNLGFRGERSARHRFFRGWLDEVHVFDAALSAAQIRSLMTRNRLP